MDLLLMEEDPKKLFLLMKQLNHLFPLVVN
jgi:hypothetical protein